MKKYILSFILLILFLAGCHHAPPPNNYGRPTRDYKMAPPPVKYQSYHGYKPRDNNYHNYKSKPSYPNYNYPNHKKQPYPNYRYPNHKSPK